VILTELGCSDTETYYFEWNNTSLDNLEIYYEDEWLRYRQVDKLIFSPLTFGARINFNYELIAKLQDLNISLIQSAYALTKPTDEYLLKDKTLSITIKTINDFDNELLAGSDISDYFKTLWAGDFISINSRLNGTNGINESRISEDYLNEEYDIYLRENPSIGEKHQFEILMEFESGKILSEMTDEIEIR
jgi:hypothetical protein